MNNFKPPNVELGFIVYWYDHPGGQPHPAIVTALGNECICCNIFDPASYNMRIRDGVRHRCDPRAKQAEMQENGCWSHRGEWKTECEAREKEMAARRLEADARAAEQAIREQAK